MKECTEEASPVSEVSNRIEETGAAQSAATEAAEPPIFIPPPHSVQVEKPHINPRHTSSRPQKYVYRGVERENVRHLPDGAAYQLGEKGIRNTAKPPKKVRRFLEKVQREDRRRELKMKGELKHV